MRAISVPSQKLKELIRQARHLNIFPIFLDRHLTRDPNNPVSLLFTDLVDDCLEALRELSDGEIGALLEEIPPGIRSLIGTRDSFTLRDAYLRRVSIYYIVSLVQAEYLSFREVLASGREDSLVLDHYPELEGKMDNEGLLVLDDELIPYDGGIEYRDHILQYHQLLRRGFTSNPNFEFLGRLVSCYQKSASTSRFSIAIDHTRLMPKEFFVQLAELDRWFGPRFDAARLDDARYVGLTVHRRLRPSIFDLTNRIDRTEFFWKHRKGIKSLEVEEISASDYLFGPYIINRYAHLERDILAHVVRHLDGAAKVYTTESYGARVESKIPNEPRAFLKPKLFRIDGEIADDTWLDLIAHFFKANEMVIEYFDPELFERAFGTKIRQFRETTTTLNSG